MSDFYINRKLHSGEQIIQDSELLHENGVFVVLAEPGAGKTDLLDFFSEHHKVARERASIFVHSSIVAQKVLIIDALDEVSRIGDHFRLSYKMLSKFAHPTAMLIMSAPDPEKERLQKDVFYSNGCMFFVGGFNALEGCLSLMVNSR